MIAVVAVGSLGGGDGGEDEATPPSEADVVSALDLLPNPAGSGWITSDGTGAVVSFDLNELAPPAQEGRAFDRGVEREPNGGRRRDPERLLDHMADCVSRVDTALKADF